MVTRPYIFNLITCENWTRLKRCLKSTKAKRLCSERDDSNCSCLALTLCYNAPAYIVEMIIEVDSSLATEKDVFGATALHIACLNGTRGDLVLLLLQRMPELVTVVDNDHRVPLHHAVEYICQPGCQFEAGHDVISLLCKAGPKTVNKSDSNGETPVDLVQHVKSKLLPSSAEHMRLHSIYILLRDVRIEVYRDDKRRWELEGYMEKLNLCANSRSRPSAADTSHSGSLPSLLNPLSEATSINMRQLSEIHISGGGVDELDCIDESNGDDYSLTKKRKYIEDLTS